MLAGAACGGAPTDESSLARATASCPSVGPHPPGVPSAPGPTPPTPPPPCKGVAVGKRVPLPGTCCAWPPLTWGARLLPTVPRPAAEPAADEDDVPRRAS